VPQVGLDGGLGDEQVLGDLAVGQAIRGQIGDLAFCAGEGVRAGDGGAAGAGRAPAAVAGDVPAGLFSMAELFNTLA
jgi:hypothetical protein